jgi:hypothetical protein
MKNQLHFLLLALLVSFGYGAQRTIEVSSKAQMVYSPYDNSYFVLDDSTHYYTYALSKGVWIKHKVHIALDATLPFEQFRGRFFPIAVAKNRYLFVMDGCGMVFALRNDTIRRIDHSYDQKNQFNSALYEYRGQVFMFGGYGLFEVKNTHSFYDNQANEWFQVFRNTKECPSGRASAYFIKDRSSLYILGGVEQRFSNRKICNDIWSFDMKRQTWKLLGELNADFIKRTRIRGFVQHKDYKIFHSDNKLTLVDIAKNKYYSYVSSRYFTFFRMLPDGQLKNVLLGVHPSVSSDRLTLKVKPLGSVLEGRPQEFYLYKPISIFKQVSSVTYLWISILLNLGLFFLVFYIRRISKTTWYRPKKPVLQRSDFSELEWIILQLIRRKQELELSSLNDFFDEPGLSHETLKKRRESFVKSLRIKLALLTRRDVETLLPESKHPLDKRMKIISWNRELEINEKE